MMWKHYRNFISYKRKVLQSASLHRRCISCTNGTSELGAGYVPNEIEGVTTNDDYFRPSIEDDKTYTMILPPPNITGTLHLGHALTTTIEDVLIRWKTMQGFQTKWIPGIDHAGIATQVAVEKNLWKVEGKSRHDIGREAFKDKVWEWKKEKADIIWQQLQRLGVSLDWQQKMFTLDENHSRSVQEAFIRLFEAGLIYRADRLVNWSCVLQSAISDIEIEHVSINGPTNLIVPGYDNPVEFGALISFAYKLNDTDDDEIVVSTTRPETIIGDVAVAVHPDDQRYSRIIGRHVMHPFRNQPIPIVADTFVDPEFGTGAVKITPAHNKDDFDVAVRHNLQHLEVINEKGNLSELCGEFEGIRRFDARKIIIEELAKKGLYRNKVNHQMIVPVCSRSKDIVEFLIKSQWFIKSNEMASRAIRYVKDGELKIEPKVFENIWFNWLENIRDWCISRQLWWGHQIPAYKCYLREDPKNYVWVAAHNENEAKNKAALKLGSDEVEFVRDEDVLDTWFSSALLPMSVFGWPDQTDDFKKYYPLSLLETGHDILFFWAARMVLLGSELTGRLPFKEILLHGIICDAHGTKMSKSLGNVITPEQVIEGRTLKDLEDVSIASHKAGILSKEELKNAINGQKKMFPNGIPACGADALRFTLVSHNIKSHFINFDINQCYTNKLFGNKIWQATKFTKNWVATVSEKQVFKEIQMSQLSKMDRWILSRLSKMVDVVNESIENYNFHIATNSLKNFLYYDFCDIYLESTKRGLREPQNIEAAGHCFVLYSCLDIGLRALAPFMPNLSAHLHQRLPFIIYKTKQHKNMFYPRDVFCHDKQLEDDIEKVMDVVVAIRRMKKIFNVTAKDKPEVYITEEKPFCNEFTCTIEDLSACHKVIIYDDASHQIPKGTIKDNVGNISLDLVISDVLKEKMKMDIPKMDIKREKLIKELNKVNHMISGSTYKIKVPIEIQDIHAKKVVNLTDQISRIDYIKTLIKNEM